MLKVQATKTAHEQSNGLPLTKTKNFADVLTRIKVFKLGISQPDCSNAMVNSIQLISDATAQADIYTLCPKKRSHFYFFNDSVKC